MGSFPEPLIQLPRNNSSGASRRGSHRLADVQICEKKWWLRYNHHLLETKDKKWRLSGTLIHQAVAWHYAEKMIEPPDWYREARGSNRGLVSLLNELGAGNPADIRNAVSCLEAYKTYWARHPGGDPWIPKYIEHEFEARVGDLDPKGKDEVIDFAWKDRQGKLHYEKRRLNNEIVTCRVDLVVDVGNGSLFVVDHKSQRPLWSKKTLAQLKDDGEFTIHWQALFNLHVVRLSLPHVMGFIIQRINRDAPWDVDRHALHIPKRMYEKTPAVIRRLVRRELQLGTEIAEGIPATPSPWACMTRYGACDYRNLCAADTQSEVDEKLAADYVHVEHDDP